MVTQPLAKISNIVQFIRCSILPIRRESCIQKVPSGENLCKNVETRNINTFTSLYQYYIQKFNLFLNDSLRDMSNARYLINIVDIAMLANIEYTLC